MLHFEGDRDVPQAPAEVWTKLHDARFLVRCIPGAEAVTRADAGEAACTVRPGFAFVRGNMEVTVRVVEAVAPSAVRLALVSKGIATSSDVAIALSIASQDGGSRIHWSADVTSLGGLLKAVPQGLIRGAADKIIKDVWANVSAQLSE
jgi:carbon monoxide dehydrogenase subunit G